MGRTSGVGIDEAKLITGQHNCQNGFSVFHVHDMRVKSKTGKVIKGKNIKGSGPKVTSAPTSENTITPPLEGAISTYQQHYQITNENGHLTANKLPGRPTYYFELSLIYKKSITAESTSKEAGAGAGSGAGAAANPKKVAELQRPEPKKPSTPMCHSFMAKVRRLRCKSELER